MMSKKISKILLIIILIVGASISAVYATNVTKSNQNIIEGEELANTEEAIAFTENTVKENKTNEGSTQSTDNSRGLGLIAVALATGLACIGAGIAVATVGSSAVGAISENPKLLGKTIIFAGLAEGIAIYGLIISIMILNKV